MDSKLTKDDVIKIANEYREKYRKKLEGEVLKYEIVDVIYNPKRTTWYETPVWVVSLDVDGWDDVWYDIVISDLEGSVVCCSCWGSEAYYPHIDTPKQKITRKNRHLFK